MKVNDDLVSKAKFPPKFEGIFDPKTYKVWYGGRGSGKTWSCCRALLIMGYEKPIRVLCVREVMASIEKSVHAELKSQIWELELESYYTVEDRKIYGPTDPKTGRRTEFMFSGIKSDPAQIKGFSQVNITWIEEAATVSQSSWEFLIPTVLREDKSSKRRFKPVMDSEIWITFNPELETNYTYQNFVVNHTPDNSMLVNINYWDNPWFPPKMQDHMEKMKTQDYNQYLHVYEGQCRKAAQGAVYGKEIERAEQEGWFREIKFMPGYPVTAYWDLGWRDATAIWVAQYVDGMIHIIDYLEYTQRDAMWGIQMLKLRNFEITKHWLPHDARQHKPGFQWTIEEILRKQNINVGIVPNLNVSTGINAVRMLWNTMRFDKTKCGSGIDRLRYYSYEAEQKVVDGEIVFSEKPDHDTASHASDALRYLAIAMKPPKEPIKKTNYFFNPFGQVNNGMIDLGQSNTNWMT